MRIKPLGAHVVVKPIEQSETTKSGIVIARTGEKDRPEQGEVLAVGTGKLLDNGQRVPMEVKVGDKVIFTKYSPTEIKVEDEELLVVDQDSILGIIQ